MTGLPNSSFINVVAVTVVVTFVAVVLASFKQ